MTAGIPVVFDATLLVGAVAGGSSPFWSWPSPPPTTGNPYAECLGVIVDAEEFSLWLSPHLLSAASRILTAALDWEVAMTERYLRALVTAAERSRGGVIIPPHTVYDCKAHENNLVLDLAAETGGTLIGLVVSGDADLIGMSPWRGTPVLSATEFVERVDAMRRHPRPRADRRTGHQPGTG